MGVDLELSCPSCEQLFTVRMELHEGPKGSVRAFFQDQGIDDYAFRGEWKCPHCSKNNIATLICSNDVEQTTEGTPGPIMIEANSKEEAMSVVAEILKKLK